MSQNIPEFFEKLKNNQQTPEEHRAFSDWLRNASPAEIDNVVKEFGEHFEHLAAKPFSGDERLFSLIEQRIDQASLSENEKKISLKAPRVTWWLKAISAAACLAAAVWLLFPQQQIPDAINQELATESKNPILPGGDKAVLVLQNGRNIILDGSQDGTIAIENGVKVDKSDDGELRYTGLGSKGVSFTNLSYNLLKTPRGGQYRLVLSDGTKVWLNAQSSIRYPAKFAPHSRVVELKGEAYFEVSKDKNRPFRVNINHTSIEVLGTHFNVMGYSDETGVKTSLLEGSVKVSSGSQSRLIKPGEQALSDHFVRVSEANVNEAVEWKNGNFNFAHEKIESIMRKIARWYDISVEYQGKIADVSFVGTIPRSQSIHTVLNYLELTGVVHFKIQGRRITVMP
ncbi:FecR family protein [Pedobacter kyonggii]|uniref:FecR family protein n=1 Tax=Pedobacter kyonggii TaxID=1926871 RepID=A0A4Q9HHL0_9SPHI|nr:FecR family protein [Pedobacter kyonggii]TBO44439.1 FecR family protein [Pedobacter kyonggii]